MKQTVVLTTIHIPQLLLDYAENFAKYGHQTESEILVIGDLKTPNEAADLVEEVKSLGVSAEYVDIPSQERWLKKFPALENIIPYNSDNRRNIGYLMAVEQGADAIIAVDDDNLVDPTGDFLGEHSIVGEAWEFDAVSSSNGWFNICTMLHMEPDRVIYPRGFPYSKRWATHEIEHKPKVGRVVINEGLWLGDPDVDSITRLTENVQSTGISKDRVVLDRGTFSPINTQNTAFHRDILPCAYFVLMGANIKGLTMDRYGDIWFGLFAKRIIDHLGDYVSFGKPFITHQRNDHDLFKDLQEELWAIVLTDKVVEFLESTTLSSSNYTDCYFELAERLEDFITSRKDVDRECREYFKQLSSAMKIWAKTCATIL